jgi:hypothetical protein
VFLVPKLVLLLAVFAVPISAQPSVGRPVTAAPLEQPAAVGPVTLYSVVGEYQGVLRARLKLNGGTCVLAVETEQGGPSKWRLCAVEFDEGGWTHRRLPELVKGCRRAEVDKAVRFTWWEPDRFGCRIAEFVEVDGGERCGVEQPCRRSP